MLFRSFWLSKFYYIHIYIMVLYHGRARQRIGSVNKNQLGFNMSGCPSKIGKSGNIIKCISRRVNCNRGNDTLTTENNQLFKNKSRLVKAAIKKLDVFFNKTIGEHGSIILVGKKETLIGDGITEHFDQILHYYHGTKEYANLPADEKNAVDCINSLEIYGALEKGGEPVPHVVGWESYAGQTALKNNGYGIPLHDYYSGTTLHCFQQRDSPPASTNWTSDCATGCPCVLPPVPGPKVFRVFTENVCAMTEDAGAVGGILAGAGVAGAGVAAGGCSIL